jgi:cytoskeletal protein RodZ
VASVGDQLRQERERQKLTVEQVADATNIKNDHIRALEQGRWEAFDAVVYSRGFLRNYARHLRLDADRLVQQFNSEISDGKGEDDDSFPPGSRRGALDLIMLKLSRIRWTWLFPVVLGLAVVASLGFGIKKWRASSPSSGSPTLGSGLIQPAPTRHSDTLAIPTNVLPTGPRH